MSIDRYLRGEERREMPEVTLPEVFIEPATVSEEELQQASRVEPPALPPESRKKNFAEVEMTLSMESATREARRCLRCDLEFTQRQKNENNCLSVEGRTG